MNILAVRWIVTSRAVIGVVKVDVEYEGIKYLVGVGDGVSESADIQYIADWGSTFPAEAGDALFNN